LWWKVADAKIRAQMLEAWDDFKDQYNDEIFRPLIQYIEKEWLNKDTQAPLPPLLYRHLSSF
jgi:hypothetical protein